MGKSRLFFFVLLILAAAVATGAFCLYRHLTGGTEFVTVRVAGGQPSVSKLPYYLAVKKQFFKEQRIRIKNVDCQDDREALTALESGKADVALVKPSSLVFRKAAGLNEDAGPVALASLDRGTRYHLVGREDKALVDIKSLKNKVVLAGSPNSDETVFLEHILRQEGLSPYESVTIITNIPGEIKMGVFKSGTGHYMLLEEKDLAAALAGGFYTARSFKTEYPSHICVTGSRSIKEQTAALQGFTNGLYMAMIWLKYHNAGETAAAIRSIPGSDPKTTARLIEGYYKNQSLPDTPLLPPKNLETMIKMLEKAREIPMPVNSIQLICDKYALNSINTVQYIPEDKQEKKGWQRLKFWQ